MLGQTAPKFLSSQVEKCASRVSISPHVCHPPLSCPHPLAPPRICCVSRFLSRCFPFCSSLFRSSHPVNALSDQNGHPGGHLGKSWEIAVGVSLGACVYMCSLSPNAHSLPRTSALWRSSHNSHRHNAPTEAEALPITTAWLSIRFASTSGVVTINALRHLKSASIIQPNPTLLIPNLRLFVAPIRLSASGQTRQEEFS